MRLHEAIYQLNPTVVTIRGDIAYDINEQIVEYNLAEAEALVTANQHKEKRASEYPPITDYLDGIVKGDQAQVQKYIDDCLAVKAKYPKGE
jgi:hypothetical protein